MNQTLIVGILLMSYILAQEQTIDSHPQLTLYSCSDTHPDETLIQLQLYFKTVKKQLNSAIKLSHQKVKSIQSMNPSPITISTDRSSIRKITSKDKKIKQADKITYRVKTYVNITITESTLEPTIKKLTGLKVTVKGMQTMHKFTMKKNKKLLKETINSTIDDAIGICNEIVTDLKDVEIIEVIEGVPYFDSINERDPFKSICTEITFTCIQNEKASK